MDYALHRIDGKSYRLLINIYIISKIGWLFMKKLGVMMMTVVLALFSFQAMADAELLKKKNVQKFVNDMVKNHGFKREKVESWLIEAKFQPQIIRSMNKPYEKKSWDVYQSIFLTKDRVQKGVAYWAENEKALMAAQKKYNVPASLIVSIIGVETLYGQRQGNYRVLDALTTLAFDYPKRAKFFTKELREFFLLSKELGVSPTQFKGSYAGAIGTPQFMPSSYRFYAVDFTGNGKRDLIKDHRDVIGSVANYIHKHGWRMNEAVAEPASVNGKGIEKIKTNTRQATYTLNKLSEAGIKPVKSEKNSPKKAGLIELITKKGEAYWIAFPNFYVITRYNTSPQYALVVYLLSQQLQADWNLSQKNKG